MKKLSLTLAATAAFAAAMPMSGAQASGCTVSVRPPNADAACTVAFHGTAHVNCFGCGVSSGTASLTVAGGASGSASASYTVNEPAATCPVQGSATGSTSGAIAVSFVWTRVGGTAVITTTGDINGAGTAAFVVAGNPCGGPVDATVAGSVSGTTP